MEAFGKALKQLRCKRGISQQKLADTFNLKRTTITNYESGRSLPNLDVFVEIVKFFDVSSDLMLGLVDDAQTDHYKPMGSNPDASNHSRTWVEGKPPRTPEEQARITRLENKLDALLEMAGSISDEIQQMRAGRL